MNGGTHKVGGVAAGFVTSSLLYGPGTLNGTKHGPLVSFVIIFGIILSLQFKLI